MPPFDPSRKLEQLCRRHGLPDGSGARFLPLMQRAALARPDLRLRMLELVDRQLRAEAEERATTKRLKSLRDEACLQAIAPLLHAWRPEKPA